MNASTEDLNVSGIATKDWRIGDYLRVDDEIMRIKTKQYYIPWWSC